MLASPAYRGVQPIARLTFTVADLYPVNHWALTGTPPAFDTPDEDVYLTGRNLVLLTKAGVDPAQRRIPRIAIGTLAGNPFPDATPDFFNTLAKAMSLGLAHPIGVDAPFMQMHKSDVIRLGRELDVPLELTLSCMNPRDGLHCGECSKCRERRDAFREAGIEDLQRVTVRSTYSLGRCLDSVGQRAHALVGADGAIARLQVDRRLTRGADARRVPVAMTSPGRSVMMLDPNQTSSKTS